MIKHLYRTARAYFAGRERRSIARRPRFTPFQIAFEGKPFIVNDSISFVHAWQEIFIDELYRFKSNSKSPVIIDCGANIGLSIIYFKKLFPSCKIIGFEPDPDLFKTLTSNLGAHNFNNIELKESACWTDDGFLSFQKEGGHSGSVVNFWDASKTIQVRTEKLSKYLNQKVDLLKIDIEGAEYEVLLEIKSCLQNVDNLILEYHSAIGKEQRLSDILATLREFGFRYHIKETFTRRRPLVDSDHMLNMDLQLNVYGVRQ